MAEEYDRRGLEPITFDFAGSRSTDGSCLTLSQRDVLAIVQSAFDELGAKVPALIAVKRDVLDEVAKGRLADALRLAIIGAGRAHCD